MNSDMDYSEIELREKFKDYIGSGEIEVIEDNDDPADYDFIYQEFPWRGQYIHWQIVPNAKYYQVKIPYRSAESYDFTKRMIEKHTLSGSVVLYGDVLMQNDYRMDISLLPTVLWDFIPIPLCLYAVSPEQKWCFSFNEYRHLNFGYVPNSLSK
ncbi:hypothetical protein WH96_05050 [Kiloniella spongiae]|uniref:Uncharacterized protein n=1 Tax=Kiloniella spongiae TaxID=1489064 RepID=A0A0H2MHN7_9PROT|nr:hypothetical protein [Kiloniella spongiae]KLN61696.1 hypothetical protein WH96_05050 [Kiloniella spongiae]